MLFNQRQRLCRAHRVRFLKPGVLFFVSLWVLAWGGVNKPVAAQQTPAIEARDASAADPYVPREGITGQLQIVGSTTVQQVAALWSDGFTGFHPEVKVTLDCRGSELAIPKLAKGGNVIALFSRGGLLST